MKPSVVYLNFALDDDWAGDSLAPFRRVRSPLAAPFAVGLEELGIFYCASGDLLISGANPDQNFLKFLKLHEFEAPRIFAPVDETWGSEVRRRAEEIKGREVLMAGLGSRENALVYLASGKVRSAGIEKYRRWNSKIFLSETAALAGIHFPESIAMDIRPGAPPLEMPAGEWVFKANHSAGGSGMIDGGEDSLRTADTIARMTQKPARWLAQRKYRRELDFYALAEVGGVDSVAAVNVETVLALAFDEKHSSIHHAPAAEGPENLAMRAAALKLGGVLKVQGYRGFFGVDGFRAAGGEMFPAVDLNVRLDKARAIWNAAEKFKIAPAARISVRRRYHDFKPAGFSVFWDKARAQLGLDESGRAGGEFCFPYLFTRAGPGAVEIQWFVSAAMEQRSAEAMDLAAKSGED